MSCNFLNSSWMQDEDIHYADALFPLIHTRVNDSFVSVSAPDDRAAVLQCCTRRLQGARMQFELWPGGAEGEDIVESCIPRSLLTVYYLVLYLLSSRYKLCASVCSSLFSSITNGCWWEHITRFGISAISAAADKWEIGCKQFLQPFLLCSTIPTTNNSRTSTLT